jgi:hypothetical protein
MALNPSGEIVRTGQYYVMATSLERLAQGHIWLDVTSGTTGKNCDFHWITLSVAFNSTLLQLHCFVFTNKHEEPT